jgi:lysozyme
MTPAQQMQCKIDEGLRLLVYDDANGQTIKPGFRLSGHPTVGYGRALDVSGITPAEADYLFNNDVLNVISMASHVDWIVALDPVRRGVIEQMLFNLGFAGTLRFLSMIEAIKKQDFEGAASAMLSSTWHKQVQGRADRLAQQMRTGTDPKVNAP